MKQAVESLPEYEPDADLWERIEVLLKADQDSKEDSPISGIECNLPKDRLSD